MLRHFPSLMQACVDDNCDEPEKIAHDAQQIDGTVMLTGGRRTSSEPPWRPRGHGLMRVAIIGAGISGLACARRLRDAGLEATLFDKSRGIGGRSEEHTSEIQSLMRISYAVLFLKKK